LCLALGLAFVFGPREPFEGEVTFDQVSIGDDLDHYLAQQESKFSDIRQGLNKQIIWHGERGEQTDIAIVYLHGFSAGEMRPVPDDVAEALGANLYYARLKGHGRTSDAMAEANADDWVNDTAEALGIGARLGKKLIVVSTSTGGSLVAYLHAHKPEWGDMIAGHIMISPNFGLADPSSALLSFPFARQWQFVPLILGDMRGKASSNALVQQTWTIPHATSALMPLARMTNEANEAPLENIDVPTLVFRSLKDKTVSPKATAAAIKRISGAVEVILIDQSGHSNHHVLAGDALSPQTNGLMTNAIIEWVKRLK